MDLFYDYGLIKFCGKPYWVILGTARSFPVSFDCIVIYNSEFTFHKAVSHWVEAHEKGRSLALHFEKGDKNTYANPPAQWSSIRKGYSKVLIIWSNSPLQPFHFRDLIPQLACSPLGQ